MEKAIHETLLNTAARHLVRSVPIVYAGDIVSGVFASLKGSSFESAIAMYVLDNMGYLIGLVPLYRLLSDGVALKMSDLMRNDPPISFPDGEQGRVAAVAVQHGLSAVPIVDEELRFLGVVSAEALIRILTQEHIEDLYRLVGLTRPLHHMDRGGGFLNQKKPADRVVPRPQGV